MKVNVYPKDWEGGPYVEHAKVDRVEYEGTGTFTMGLVGADCPTKRVLHINMANVLAVLLELED